MKRRPIAERFWEKVDKKSNDECWEWRASIRTSGYGQFYIRHGKPINASRFSYMLNYKTNPKDLEVCHKCDNRKCVNPNHLFLGTHQENMLDAVDKGRAIDPPPPPKGERNWASKFTKKDILEMISLYKDGHTKTELAKKYSVTKQAVGLILNGANWSHVTGIQKEKLT